MIRIGTRKSVCSYLWSYELWHPKIIYRNWKPACLLAYITSSLRHCMTRYTLSDKHWLASEQMVEWWFWWDSTQAWYRRLTDFIQWFDAVSLVIWPVKIVPEMTYYVSSGTLNLADSLCGRVDISQTGVSRQHLLHVWVDTRRKGQRDGRGAWKSGRIRRLAILACYCSKSKSPMHLLLKLLSRTVVFVVQ